MSGLCAAAVFHEFAARNNARAHARAEGEEHAVCIFFGRAELRFAQRRRVGVVYKTDGSAQALGEIPADRFIRPAVIAPTDHYPAVPVYHARRGEPYAL